jgi:hypothetical protein
MMSSLKLYGMRSAYDETLATALKRKHEPQRLTHHCDIVTPIDSPGRLAA